MNNLSPKPLDPIQTGNSSFSNQKKRKKPVTLIVGIICKDGIVMASESQTTFGESKRCDAEKIRIVEFKTKEAILVAQSGAEDISNRLIDQMEARAKNQEFENEESVVRLTQEAMFFVSRLLKNSQVV